MAIPEPLGTFTDYQSFVALLRAQKERLGLSDLQLDAIAGLTDGHTGKLLGPAMVKTIGGLTFTPLLDALQLSGTLFIDGTKPLRKAERRAERAVRDNGRVGRDAIQRARPAVLAEQARKAAAKRWAGSTPEQRWAVGRQLAEARRKACAGT
jgi:hypothetical protein